MLCYSEFVAAQIKKRYKICLIIICVFVLAFAFLLIRSYINTTKQVVSDKQTVSPTLQSLVQIVNKPDQQKNGAILIKTFEGGKLYKQNGINLIVLSGTFRQMGRQYGALLGDQINQFYQDGIIKPFVGKKIFTEKQLLDGCETSFQNQPKRQKELLTGMAQTSGLSVEKVTCASDVNAIMILARLKMTDGNVDSCTSGAIWGEYTTDGTTLTARNFDFPNFFRALAKKYATAVVFKPTDGSNALAGIGLVGSITYLDMMNDKGIYTETNNGANSGGLVLFSNRVEQTTQITNILFDADNPEQFDVFINSNRPSYPTINLVARS